MAQMGVLWCPKQRSSANSGSSGGGPAEAAGFRRCSGLRRLVKKLKKQSKMLCITASPAAFHCQYDPLSYARNFDRSGFGTSPDDDSSPFHHSFSSRFAAAVGPTNHQLAQSTNR